MPGLLVPARLASSSEAARQRGRQPKGRRRPMPTSTRLQNTIAAAFRVRTRLPSNRPSNPVIRRPHAIAGRAHVFQQPLTRPTPETCPRSRPYHRPPARHGLAHPDTGTPQSSHTSAARLLAKVHTKSVDLRSHLRIASPLATNSVRLPAHPRRVACPNTTAVQGAGVATRTWRTRQELPKSPDVCGCHGPAPVPVPRQLATATIRNEQSWQPSSRRVSTTASSDLP